MEMTGLHLTLTPAVSSSALQGEMAPSRVRFNTSSLVSNRAREQPQPAFLKPLSANGFFQWFLPLTR